MRSKFILTVLFLILCRILQAQNNEPVPDSGSVPLRQQQMIEEMLIARHQDSLEKLALIRQLSYLKIGESQQRQSLRSQLEEYRSKDSLREARLKSKIDSLRHHFRGVPVVPFPSDTLFYIYAKVASLSAADRARMIAERIRKVGDGYKFLDDSLITQTAELSTDIIYNGFILMGITEIDARWMQTQRDSLATRYRDIISRSIQVYQQEINWETLLKKAGIALGILVILILVITLIVKSFARIGRFIEGRAGTSIRGIKIKDYELLNISREVRIILFFFGIIKWLLILLAVYFSLPVLFSLFPWTRQLADLLIGYILTPAKFILSSIWNYLPNLFTILLIVLVFRYVLKGLKYVRKEIEIEALKIPGFYPDLANPTYQIARVLIYAFMLVVIFPFLPGSNSPVFQGVSVFLGVLFTFGSSGSLSNLISGVVITYMRSFQIGDRVKIGDVTGDVIERSMLVTRIRTIKNEVISIPNSSVLGNHLTNYSSDAASRGLIINSTVTIGYDTPWRQVHDLLIRAALDTPGIEKEPSPFVLQTSLDDFFVSYQVNAYTRSPNTQAQIYSSLHENIQDKFSEEGVEIMSPHYRAQRDGNTVTIPSFEPGSSKRPFDGNVERTGRTSREQQD